MSFQRKYNSDSYLIISMGSDKMLQMKHLIKSTLRNLGYEITEYPRNRFLAELGINLIFDVGANTGQYGLQLRKFGYKEKIVSFEPVLDAYQELISVIKDPAWVANNYALGKEEGEAEINISKNSVSSSLLNIAPDLMRVLPELSTVQKKRIPIKRLDDIFWEYYHPGDNVYLKIDTQGYEKEILVGAAKILHLVQGLELEMSLSYVYKNEVLIEDIFPLVRKYNFIPVWLSHGFKHPITKRLLQVDGIFLKSARL